MHLNFCSSNHSGNNGSSGSLPSGGNGVSSLNSDETNNSEYLNNNNNSADISAGAEICDVPYEVANQKRHVSSTPWPSYKLSYLMFNSFQIKCCVCSVWNDCWILSTWLDDVKWAVKCYLVRNFKYFVNIVWHSLCNLILFNPVH